jgi:translation initiation factor 4G
VIKNPDGEVMNFDTKKAASPAPPPQPRSPAIVSTPTPPPRAPSAAESSHSRTESVAKTLTEKRQEFIDQFQKNLKKDDADKKAIEEKEAKAKAEAEAKAAKEKEEAEAKAAKEKEEADKAAKEKEAAEKAAKEKEEAEKAEREEAERIEREIAEMEALEREEEERERAYQEKKKKAAEEKAKREAEAAKNAEEELRRQEREAEEREAARAGESAEAKAEKEALFASLKKNTQFGPAATMASSDAPAPAAEPVVSAPVQATQPRIASAGKSKPAALKLETNKPVEPAQPTPGMQALKSARFLQVLNESIIYPDGVKSPNPALNQGSRSKGRQYDKDFLLQFKDIFKEKPLVDWDLKLKETVGDGSDSARPQSARTPMGMGSRQPSRSAVPVGGISGGAMGSFMGGRTIPAGTTSEQRFNASNTQPARPTMVNPLAQFGNRPPSFMGGQGQMNRTGSFANVGQAGGPNSPRNGSSRGKGGSRRGPDNKGPRRDEEQQAKAMPLTAGKDLKPLERSQTGWKPISIAAPQAAAPQPGAGHMGPEMVQRKVKAALNKMTPEKFDKLADQILDIAAQSKDEPDGRTLRQIIQLTFEKATDEAHWASMYAKFCQRMLSTMSPDIKDENVRDKTGNPVVGGALFRKYLLNRCQEEFERGWEVNLPAKPEGQTEEAAMLSDEYYIAAAAKRRGLGLIQFIGELYKLGMLTLRIMHECVLKLLDFEGMPDESAIESLVKLLRTVGATMESTDSGPKMIGMYFERIQKIMNMEGLPSRLHFMLLDTVEIRRKGWKSKDDAKGPKTIQEIHQEALVAQQNAEMERNRSNQRGGPRLPMGRGDARSFSGGGMMPPPDYPRDRVGMDDLRKLSKGASGRNLSNSPAQLGPSSLFGSRSSSGRKGLGPTMMRGGEESGASSRTGTPPRKDQESTTHMNSFSALAALDASGEGAGDVGSPPSTTSSPPVTKSVPAAAETKEDGGKPSDS